MRRLILICCCLFLVVARASAADAPATTDPHAHLQQILQRPMFQAWRLRQDRETSLPELSVSKGLGRWLTKLGQQIGDFWDWLFKSKPATPAKPGHPMDVLPTVLKVGAWTTLGVGLIFFGIVIYRVLRKPQTRFAMGQILSRHQINEALESGDALALDSKEWMDEARRLAAEQNFRAVYRALYLALLSGLHTVGKIEHSRNRTNWTYVQHYRGPAAERETFSGLTDLFDRVWYGRKAAAGNDLDALQAQIASLTRTGDGA